MSETKQWTLYFSGFSNPLMPVRCTARREGRLVHLFIKSFLGNKSTGSNNKMIYSESTLPWKPAGNAAQVVPIREGSSTDLGVLRIQSTPPYVILFNGAEGKTWSPGELSCGTMNDVMVTYEVAAEEA